jgi:hypothetical protein
VRKRKLAPPSLPDVRFPREALTSARAAEAAIRNYLEHAPRDAQEQLRAIIAEVKAAGGWRQEYWPHWRWLLSALLYAAYCADGEQPVLERLSSVAQIDLPFFLSQWWIAALIRQWKTQGAAGKKKLRKLVKRHAGERESHKQKAERLARNARLVAEIDKRLAASRALRLEILTHEEARLRGDPRKKQERTLILDKIAELRDPRSRPSGIGLTRILKEIAAEQERFGADGTLAWTAIRKIYREYLTQRFRRTATASSRRGFRS